MREFWVASGHHLTHRLTNGWLAVTPELILAWLARPELAPPPEACAAERALYDRLLAAPLRKVALLEIDAIADPDGRENWQLFLAMRDHMIASGSVEAGYMALVRNKFPTAPVLLAQLCQLVLRNALDGVEDVQTLRAAENFFRPQQGFLTDGELRLVDLELAEEMEAAKAANPLAALFNGGIDSLDTLGDGNGWTYWSRSDAHSMVQNFGGDQAARAGMARVIAAFIRHLHRIDVLVTPMTRADDVDLAWFVGLTPEGTAVGNALWQGQTPRHQLVGLFALDFGRDARILPHVQGRTVWAIMAVNEALTLYVKPQNLIDGLPFIPEVPQ